MEMDFESNETYAPTGKTATFTNVQTGEKISAEIGEMGEDDRSKEIGEAIEAENLATIGTLIVLYPKAFSQEVLETGETITVLNNKLDDGQTKKNWNNNPSLNSKWETLPRSKMILAKDGITIIEEGGNYNYQMNTLMNEIVRPVLKGRSTRRISYNRISMEVRNYPHILTALDKDSPDTAGFIKYLKSINEIREEEINPPKKKFGIF